MISERLAATLLKLFKNATIKKGMQIKCHNTVIAVRYQLTDNVCKPNLSFPKITISKYRLPYLNLLFRNANRLFSLPLFCIKNQCTGHRYLKI